MGHPDADVYHWVTTTDAAVCSTTSYAITACCKNNVIGEQFKVYILVIFLIYSHCIIARVNAWAFY
jgi:hypothetical protein